jgi:hypothetical protein
MSRNVGWGRLALLSPRTQEAPHGYDFASNVMRVDTEAICPRCFGWITAHDIVRRTAYGLLQHEACPVTDEPHFVSELST